MIAPRLQSLQEVAAAVLGGQQFNFALRDFLDGFYADPRPEKLKDEPSFLQASLGDSGFADAYLAAVCDHLCRERHFVRPGWIGNPARILKMPYFAARSHGLRMIYLQESPTAFKQRNIFVSSNTLTRA